MQRDTSKCESFVRVVIMPNLLREMKSVRSLIFSSVPGSSRFLALYLSMRVSVVPVWMVFYAYGSAGLEPVSALENDMFAVDVL